MDAITLDDLRELAEALLAAQSGPYAPATAVQVAEMAADAGWLSDGEWTRAAPVGMLR